MENETTAKPAGKRYAGTSGSDLVGKTIEDTDTGIIGKIVDETDNCVGVQWPDMKNAIDYRQKSDIQKL